jgi:predicted permease
MFYWRRKSRDEDLERELRSHLDLETAEQREAGLSDEDAGYAARRAFGNTTLLKEEVRKIWRWTAIEQAWQDVRYALRTLRNAPVFTATALLSLGLGIGANTAIFTLLYTVLLKPLPVPNPEQLVVLGLRDSRHPKELQTRSSYPSIEALKTLNKVFAGPFTYVSDFLKLSTGGEPEPIRAALVSGNYFPALRATAERGRTFSEADDLKGAPHPVAVISHRLWQQRFGDDVDAIGRVIRLNGYPITIIGIMRADFFGTQVGVSPDIWAPIQLMDRLSLPGIMLENRDATWLPAMARLNPGLSRERAEAEADILLHRMLAEMYGVQASALLMHLVLLPGSQGLSKLQQQFSKPLRALMVLVTLLLLITCANVASLLLARAMTRQKEIALRLAIGASRGRIVRQVLTESTVVALAGGALGILMAFESTRLLVKVLPSTQTLLPQVDWRVLMFCFATSIAAGVFFGLAPAWQTTKSEITSAIKNDAAQANRSRRLGIRDMLLAGQVALAIVLLVGAALLVGTLRNLSSANSGFRSDNVLQLSLNPRQAGYTAVQMRSFYDRLLDRVRALPGVHAASFIDSGLMSERNQSEDLYPPGYQPGPNEDVFSEFNAIAPSFFETLGIARVAGRDFDTRDDQGAPNVAIVNEPYARHFFGARDPIGQHIGVGGKPDATIVGIVRATKYRSMRDESPRIVYFPFAQAGFGQTTLYVQAGVAPLTLVASIRRIAGALDKDAAVYDIKTLARQMDESMWQERLIAWLSSFFGLFALVLAATGLYGVVSYRVSTRTREIGIRMALGAERGQVVRSVLRQIALLTISGIAFGLIVAFVAARFVGSLLYGLSPRDPIALAVAAAIMLAAAVVAAYLPAIRASKVDPMVALRYE